MRCHDCRIAISSGLDGEDPGRPAAAIDDHLQRCDSCRAFAQEATALHRSVRLAPVATMRDLAPGILHAIGREGERNRRDDESILGLRICLVFIGLIQIAVAVPALILGDDAGLPVHTARHIGSFTTALAVGFLFVAWRPERATGLLPVTTALVALVVGSTALDVFTGQAAAFSESGHVTEVVGLVVIALLARARAVRARSVIETASA